MGINLKVYGLLLLIAFSSAELRASDWKKIAGLEGTWYFTVGDDPAWSDVSVDLGDWDQIAVPDKWERFYEGYNGFAWYRKTFDLKELPSSNEFVVFLGYIDDVDEVFLNGEKIGQSGKFPPGQVTAYDIVRKYPVPGNLLKPKNNVIAVRVYDEGKEGGIISGDRIGVYYDAELDYLLYDLSGEWKFTTRRDENIHSFYFDDSGLGEVYVPATWESQGYDGYDGYGWYRKKFTLPGNFPSENLYLVLGQVDEIDKVYLNGNLIGQTQDLEAWDDIDVDDAYLLYRSYRIPDGALKKENIVSVEVLDKYGAGGIYTGPVGIMTKENRNKFMKGHEVEKRKNPFRWIFEYFLDWDEEVPE